MKGKFDTVVDIIPVNFVSNYMIVIGAINTIKKDVYNLSTSNRNPLRLGRIV